MIDKLVSVTLTKTEWQVIVNMLDQERNVVKAMPRGEGALEAVLNGLQDAIARIMTSTIDSICQQAGVVAGQKIE